MRTRALMVTLGAMCWVCAGSPARAAPAYVRLSVIEGATHSMGVAWTTLSGSAGTTVKYGTAKGTYTKTATGKATAVSSTLGTVSEATLTGLAADTVYYYVAGGGAGGFSPEYSFRTGPAKSAQCGSSTFVVFGDSRAESWQGDKGASDMWKTLSQAALKKSPDFFIHGGDIVHDGDKQKQWDNHLKATAPVSALVPIMYTIGNHDTGPGTGSGANFNKIFHLPRSSKTLGGSGTEDHYYFTWGNAIFVSLSTEGYSVGSIKFKDQADWLDKVLTQVPRRWRFVTLHRPIYTHRIDVFGLDLSHPPDEAGHNAAFVPVLNKHHVDVVFQSHNHFYERFAPSKCAAGSSTKPCPVSSFAQGTVHITTGGGGAFPLVCPLLCPGPVNKVRVKASFAQHYLFVKVKDHAMTLQAINTKGKSIDTFTITKAPPSPDPCAAPPDAGVPDVSTPDALAPDALAPDASAADGTAADQAAVSADAPLPDAPAASVDAGGQFDTGAHGGDPGGGAGDSGGCSCRASGGGGAIPPTAWLLIAVFVVFRRRSRP